MALGKTSTGILLQAQPKKSLLEHCGALESGLPTTSVDSRLFFRERLASTYRSIEMNDERATNFGQIRINTSTITLMHRGYTHSKSAPSQNPRSVRYWYSISASSLPVDEVNRKYSSKYQYEDRGLRSYLKSNRQLWIGQDSSRPLNAESRLEMGGQFKFRNQLWPYPDASEDAVMERSRSSIWRVSPLKEWVEAPGKVENMPDVSLRNASLNGIATEWIDFERTRIEFPIAQYAWRFVYESETDSVVVFHLDLAPLINQ